MTRKNRECITFWCIRCSGVSGTTATIAVYVAAQSPARVKFILVLGSRVILRCFSHLRIEISHFQINVQHRIRRSLSLCVALCRIDLSCWQTVVRCCRALHPIPPLRTSDSPLFCSLAAEPPAGDAVAWRGACGGRMLAWDRTGDRVCSCDRGCNTTKRAHCVTCNAFPSILWTLPKVPGRDLRQFPRIPRMLVTDRWGKSEEVYTRRLSQQFPLWEVNAAKLQADLSPAQVPEPAVRPPSPRKPLVP